MPSDLARFGEIREIAPPRAKIEVDRSQIANVLTNVLANYSILDVSVEDPPLEEVIASLFTLTEKQQNDSTEASIAAAAANVAAAGKN